MRTIVIITFTGTLQKFWFNLSFVNNESISVIYSNCFIKEMAGPNQKSS